MVEDVGENDCEDDEEGDITALLGVAAAPPPIIDSSSCCSDLLITCRDVRRPREEADGGLGEEGSLAVKLFGRRRIIDADVACRNVDCLANMNGSFTMRSS